MEAIQIKREIARIIGRPLNTLDLSVKRTKVSYQDRYQWTICSMRVNLWHYEAELKTIFEGYEASSASLATIPARVVEA